MAGGQFYLGEVVGYNEAEDTFQLIYNDEASRIARAQGLKPEVGTPPLPSLLSTVPARPCGAAIIGNR